MKRGKTAVLGVLCITFLFLFISRFTLINVSTLEDSIWLKPAIDIAHGQVLFRDTFSPYGMFVPLLQGLTVKIFGEYLLPLRMVSALFYAITAFILYHLWSRFMTKKMAFISVILWAAMAPFYDNLLLPWSSIYALVFQTLAFLLMIYYIEKRRTWLIFLCGATIMLTILTRQPVGVLLFAAIFLYFITTWFIRKYPFKPILIAFGFLCFGMALTFVPFLIYLLINRALGDWWIQSFVFAKEYAIVVRGISFEQLMKSLLMGRYFKLGEYHLMIIWLLIPLSSFYILLKPLFLYFKKKQLHTLDLKFILAGLVCLGSWVQYYPMTEPVHFFWAATPIIGFFVYTISNLFVPNYAHLNSLFTILLGVLAVSLLLIRVVGSIPRFKNASVYSQTMRFLKNIKITTYENKKINAFYHMLISHMTPKDTYINISDDAMIPLLDGRFHQIPPLYEQWNFFAERLYPDYYTKVNSYITNSHPVIVTRTLPYVKNYCTLKNVEYPQLYMDIHIPIERVLDVKSRDNVMEIISHYPDMFLTAASELQTPITAFSVPDMKKLILSPIEGESSSFPYLIEQNVPVEIPLKKSASWIILKFASSEIDTCSVSVNNHYFGK